MPELPEVETVRRGLAPVMEGARFLEVQANRGDLRWPLPRDFAQRLRGQTVTRLGRRGKYLLAELSSGEVLLMHLGMSGSFRVAREGAPTTPGAYYRARSHSTSHDHVVFHMSSGARITFNDPRRFGSLHLVASAEAARHPLLAGLGPEPLAPGFDGARLAAAARGRRASVKALLLDQRVVAGVGNIYACESLFRARIRPARPAGAIARARLDRLAAALAGVLAEAIAAGGSSLRDHARVSGELGYFQHRFAVYGRAGEPCPACGTPVRRTVEQGRSSFFCPRCQR